MKAKPCTAIARYKPPSEAPAEGKGREGHSGRRSRRASIAISHDEVAVATIAESGHDVGFGGAVESCLGEPCRQRDEGGLVHIDYIYRSAYTGLRGRPDAELLESVRCLFLADFVVKVGDFTRGAPAGAS